MDAATLGRWLDLANDVADRYDDDSEAQDLRAILEQAYLDALRREARE